MIKSMVQISSVKQLLVKICRLAAFQDPETAQQLQEVKELERYLPDRLAGFLDNHMAAIFEAAREIQHMGTEGIRDLLLSQASPAEMRIIELRDKFARTYCTERGWDIENLSMEQLLEIRRQPGWECTEQIEAMLAKLFGEEEQRLSDKCQNSGTIEATP